MHIVDSATKCQSCETRHFITYRYVEELKLPTHPDMTFASNLLRLEHADGYGIEFTCMDALRCLSSDNYVPKVAAAQAWRESR